MHTEGPSSLSSSPTEFKEVRHWRRYPVELSSSVSSTGPEWSGTAVNLSGQGCAIQSTTPVKTGDYLKVLLFPGSNQAPIEVEMALVRWASNGQFGVQFLTLAPRDAIRLHDLLTLFEG